MAKFYFTAVSNSAKTRFVGSITSEAEKEAREQLNKIGLAILSMSSEQPADWQNAFAFSILDKNGRELTGELIADSDEEVFEHFADDLDVKKINWICRAEASEEEKLHARENSVQVIIAKKKKEEEKRAELEKRTITGSLRSLVQMGKEEKPAKWEENLKKFSSKDEEDLTKKTAADVADPNKPKDPKTKQQAAPTVEASSHDSVSDTANAEATETPGTTETKTAEPETSEGTENIEKEADWRDQLQKIKDKFIHFFPVFSEKFGKFYFYLTEIVIPPKGKTRKDGWNEMRRFLFPPKSSVEISKTEDDIAMKRKALLERFWIAFEEIIDLLAAVFIAYLALGITALYVEIPRISELAETTLRGNFTIHFLAGTFVFIRILILLREKFTSWSILRTSLLFLGGGLLLFFAGINLL